MLGFSSLANSGSCKHHGRKEPDGDKLAFYRDLLWAPESQGNMAFLKPKHEVLYSFTEKIMLSRVIRKWHLLPRVNMSILSKGCNSTHILILLAALLFSFGNLSLSCLPQIPLQDTKFPAHPWIRFGC